MTTVLFDGNNLTMRALFVMRRSALSAGGVNTGPLMVTINSLSKVIGETQPDRMLVAWDGGTSAMRRALDPAYKAHRTPITGEEKESRDSTFALVKEFMALAAIPNLRLAGIEADDLIAAAWAKLTPADEPGKIVIVSSDKDFLQLLGPNPHGVPTEQIRLGSAETDTDVWTADRLVTDMGFTPERWPLVTALTGDEADGVAGVPGIGPKRAVKLLEATGWDLTKATEEVARSKPDAAGRIATGYQLVNLRDTDFPIEVPLWRPVVEGSLAWGPLVSYLDRYELGKIKARLLSGALWRPFAASPVLPGRALSKRSGD